MRYRFVRKLRIRLFVLSRQFCGQVVMREAIALIRFDPMARLSQINPDLEAVRTLDKMEITTVQIDHGLVIHGRFHRGEVRFHLATQDSLHGKLGAASEHQPRMPDQAELEQPLQEQLARREHALEVFLARLHAILFDCLQE
ncbi:hypothetical protein D9M71_508880 [compost metagenome]